MSGNIRIPHALMFFLAMMPSAILLGQDYDNPIGITNRVFVQYSDSIVETSYYRGDKKIKLKPERMYYWYSTRDIKHTRGAFDGKLLHGNYTLFYYNKDLQGKGIFKYGLKDGTWETWYQGGEIKSREKWSKGIIKGVAIYYDVQGRIQKKNTYKNGTRILEIAYDTSGVITSRKKFKRNKLVKETFYVKNKKGKYVPVKEDKEIKPARTKTKKNRDGVVIEHEQPSKKTNEKKRKPKEKSGLKIKVLKFRQILPGGQST